jgi:hypothetical protein
VTITLRKASDHLRRECCQRRGGGRIVGEAALDAANPEAGRWLEQVVGREPTPTFVAQVVDECRRRLESLGDEGLRMVALLRMEGYSNDQIAERVGCGLRSVERVLADRKRWLAESALSAGVPLTLPVVASCRPDRSGCDQLGRLISGPLPRIEDHLGRARAGAVGLLHELMLVELNAGAAKAARAGVSTVFRTPRCRASSQATGPRGGRRAAASRRASAATATCFRHPCGADGLRHP